MAIGFFSSRTILLRNSPRDCFTCLILTPPENTAGPTVLVCVCWDMPDFFRSTCAQRILSFELGVPSCWTRRQTASCYPCYKVRARRLNWWVSRAVVCCTESNRIKLEASSQCCGNRSEEHTSELQ